MCKKKKMDFSFGQAFLHYTRSDAWKARDLLFFFFIGIESLIVFWKRAAARLSREWNP
jgi:hypothetical protein